MMTSRSGGAHVAVILYGSRGDVQPGVSLAVELQRRGHRVSVAVPPNMLGFARNAGLATVVAIGRDTGTQWSSDEALNAQRSRNPWTRARFALATVRDGISAFDRAMVETFLGDDAAITDVDMLIAAPLCQARGLALAERLGVPLTVLRYAPMSESGVIGPLPGVTDSWSPEWKRRSWRAYDRIVWWATRYSENGFRRRIGRPPARTGCPDRLGVLRVPQIQAYDPAIAPGLVAEWKAGHAVKPIIGFLDLPAGARDHLAETSQGDAQLAEWLDAGDPPVFVGFGSMPVTDPQRVRSLIGVAAAELGVRCVFGLGASPGVDADDTSIYHVGAVNHAWLFPHCAAVVHHGGAGTTAAALRAGVPSAVYSFTAEQPFWAERIRTLGVGTGRAFSALTDESIRADLSVALTEKVRCVAADFAQRMVPPERAVAAAADIVEVRLPVPAGE
ncbi:glycosyltransferase [Gordonia sp. NPDC003950]